MIIDGLTVESGCEPRGEGEAPGGTAFEQDIECG
jgi:hypothetical protein